MASVVNALNTSASETPSRAASGAGTVSARVTSSAIVGTLDAPALAFTANLMPVSGVTANLAGFYKASVLGATEGSVHLVASPTGQVYTLSRTPAAAATGIGSLAGDGSFELTEAGLSGRIDETTTVVTGELIRSGAVALDYAGLATTTARTDRLVNLSSRLRVGPAASRTLIIGFVITGEAPKPILLRAIGPALAGFGLNGALADPRLRLYDATGRMLLENDTASAAENAAAARVGAFALAVGSRDAAQLTTLAPGAYTMHVLDGGDTGVALAEIYDASLNPNADYQRLVNISTRGEAGIGDATLIGGFIVAGNSPKRVLVRGIGPALTALGLDGVLADPRLAVYRGSRVVGENDDWSSSPSQAAVLTEAARTVAAFALPVSSRDASLLLTLAPGVYTAQVTPASGQSPGLALVEIYEVP